MSQAPPPQNPMRPVTPTTAVPMSDVSSNAPPSVVDESSESTPVGLPMNGRGIPSFNVRPPEPGGVDQSAPYSNPSAPHTNRPSAPAGTGALEGDSLRSLLFRLDRQGQLLLDRIAPYKMYRWIGLICLLLLFFVRMFLLEGFYIVAYVLFIYILNQFILFLQPKDRAALVAKAASSGQSNSENSDNGNRSNNNSNSNGNSKTLTEDGENDDGATLPTFDDEEFRPFVRRLPEFKFWYSTTYASVLAFWATFFSVFDVPVFWPLLLVYFIILFVATMRKQWLDMKKLKYVPWDIGTKKVYRSDPKRVSVARTHPDAPHSVVNNSGRSLAPVPTIQVPPKKTTATQSANTTTL